MNKKVIRFITFIVMLILTTGFLWEDMNEALRLASVISIGIILFSSMLILD